MHGGCAVGMVGLPESEESPKRLMVLIGYMDGGEMAAPVQPGEHHGIEPVGFAMIPGSSGNKRRSDDLAGEAVIGEKTLQNEPCSRGLVAASQRSFCREAAKEPTDLHEVPRELHHLGSVALG